MNARREFFRYVIPSMLAFALSGVYAIADGFFVGNALGDSALAAINIAFPLTAFLQAVGTGIGMGGAIQYAISKGEGNELRARRYFGTAFFALLLSGALLTAVFLLAAPSALHFLGASGEILSLAREYILYISYGAVFQILGTGLVPFIRNMGSATFAMAAMIVGFLTNILLEYLFVWVFPWGMMGAAVATAIGQAMTFLACMVFFLVKRQKPLFQFGRAGLSKLKTILAVGLSPFGLTFSPNLTLILVNRSAAAVGGDPAVTCYATVSYISCVVLLLLQGVSDGSQPLLSLSYGQGKLKKTKAVLGTAYRFALLVAVCSMTVLFFVREQMAALFGASEQVVQNVAQILPVFLAGYVFAAVSRITTAYCYATCKNAWAYLLIYGEPVCLFLLLLFLPGLLGIYGTWAAVPISQAAAMGLSIAFLVKQRRDERTDKKYLE